MRFSSSCYKILDPYIWHSFCSWSVELFTQGFHQKAAYFPNDGWTLKCPIFSSDVSLKNVNKLLWWLVDFKLHRAEERKYCEAVFLINKTSMPWKIWEGKYKSNPTISDVTQGHAEDQLCPVFLSREFKISEYSSIQRCSFSTGFLTNNHRRL